MLIHIYTVGYMRDRRRPQFRDQLQDFGDRFLRNCDLGHLEGDDIAAVADDRFAPTFQPIAL